MKALTLYQPWAGLVAANIKTIETRPWVTRYRGPVAIHAAALRFGFNSKTADWVRDGGDGSLDRWRTIRRATTTGDGDPELCDNYALGAVVAIIQLDEILPIVGPGHELDVYPHLKAYADNVLGRLPAPYTTGDFDRARDQFPWGDYTHGRFAWMLSHIRPIKPIPATGRQGLWNWGPPTTIHYL